MAIKTPEEIARDAAINVIKGAIVQINHTASQVTESVGGAGNIANYLRNVANDLADTLKAIEQK